jgi:YHS domain-containing protein
MEGVLWLLGYALLFYFMMRFGCGSHMVHGHGGHGGHGGGDERSSGSSHAGHGTARQGGAGVVDPVCGMKVAPEEGYSRRYRGQEYRFCSRNCLDQFEADPARYSG